MGAVVLADPKPAVPIRKGGPRRYAVPALLVAGWGGLFAYCAAYLTEDMPFRPQRFEAVRPAEVGPARESEDGPRRVVVVAAPPPEAPRPESPRPESPTAAVASVQAPPGRPQVPPAAPPRSAPAPGPAPAPVPMIAADYVGVWGPTAEACGARSRRRGFIPATITADRARAGRTVCSFRDGRRSGNAWTMAAECSDRGRRWSSQVRLVVDGDRLTWSSSRGTSAYVRCPRRAG